RQSVISYCAYSVLVYLKQQYAHHDPLLRDQYRQSNLQQTSYLHHVPLQLKYCPNHAYVLMFQLIDYYHVDATQYMVHPAHKVHQKEVNQLNLPSEYDVPLQQKKYRKNVIKINSSSKLFALNINDHQFPVESYRQSAVLFLFNPLSERNPAPQIWINQ